MTTSWITQLSMELVLIGVGIDNPAVTHRLISEGGSFTVNLWDSEETRPFVKFSKPAVFEDGALNGRAVHDGVTGAPIFDEAIAWMECEVRQAHDLGTHTLFIGEVVDAAILDDEKRPAAMTDTRMKYGGVHAVAIESRRLDLPKPGRLCGCRAWCAGPDEVVVDEHAEGSAWSR